MNIFKVLKNVKNLFNKNKKDHKDLIIEELTKKEEAKDKLLLKAMWVFLSVLLVFFLIICLLVVKYMPEGPLQLVVIILSTIILLVAAFFALKLEVEAGYYECKNCHHKHKPEYKRVLMAMHMGTTRFLKCPECGQRSWSKKVLTK
jgi:hypothetical protein